jgi:5-formyltetrahydrofolate cyclo-ligase
MLYMHFRSEVQTAGLLAQWLAQGKTVCVPRVLRSESLLLPVRISDPDRDLLPGYCGIPEPAPSLPASSVLPPATIDAVIVPGSVFDPKGGRLGYGGGYYDRFLSRDAPQALRIALAFDLQVVERVPTEAHDQPVDIVVTEHNLYPCRRTRHAQDRRLPR